jgi:hypothetical protein
MSIYLPTYLSMALIALVDLGLFSRFLISTQLVGPLGRGISPSQGRYLHRINAGIHASSVIRNHDPSVRAGEDALCLRPHGHCDRHD